MPRPCEPGHHCSQPQMPRICPPGKYQDTENSVDCKRCPKGHYCPADGLKTGLNKNFFHISLIIVYEILI